MINSVDPCYSNNKKKSCIFLSFEGLPREEDSDHCGELGKRIGSLNNFSSATDSALMKSQMKSSASFNDNPFQTILLQGEMK